MRREIDRGMAKLCRISYQAQADPSRNVLLLVNFLSHWVGWGGCGFSMPQDPADYYILSQKRNFRET